MPKMILTLLLIACSATFASAQTLYETVEALNDAAADRLDNASYFNDAADEAYEDAYIHTGDAYVALSDAEGCGADWQDVEVIDSDLYDVEDDLEDIYNRTTGISETYSDIASHWQDVNYNIQALSAYDENNLSAQDIVEIEALEVLALGNAQSCLDVRENAYDNWIDTGVARAQAHVLELDAIDLRDSVCP